MGKYGALFRISFMMGIKNYKALVGLSVFLMACLLIFANLWKVVAIKTGAVGLHSEQLLWYIAFNEWVLVSIPDPEEMIEEDLRSGRLVYQLLRPISYLGSIFAESLGILCVNLTVLGGVTFVFTWFQVGSLPFSLLSFIPVIIFGIAAGVLGILFQMIIGLSSFWLHESSPCYWVWEKLLFMFGGLMLPLTVYPQWIQSFANWTPFPLILGQRSALALDYSGSAIAWLSCLFVVWGLIGVISLKVLFQRALRILNIEGG